MSNHTPGSSDGFGGKKLALERFKALRNKPAFVVSHGHYRGVYADTISRSEARRRLGLAPDGPVVVYFGLIRPYKNVPLLIRTFRQLDDPKAKLCIAGKPDTPRLAREIEAAVGDDPRVKVVFEFIPDDEVQLYLRTADLMVLPFTEILNSGSALLALSFDCPVLIPNKGSMQELAQRVGKEWVQTYVGDLTIQILDQALRFALDIRRAARAPLEQFDWALVAAQTLEAYQKTCAGQSPPPRL
jgi:glycosyltransferase involved in cell wall biosynthesis